MAISMTSNSPDPWGIFELVTEEENDSSTEVSNALEAPLGDHSQRVGMEFVSHINNLLVCCVCVCVCYKQASKINFKTPKSAKTKHTHTYIPLWSNITSSLWSLWHVLQLCFSFQALRAKFRQSLHCWYRQGLSRRRSQGDSERYLRVFIAAVDGHDVHF